MEVESWKCKGIPSPVPTFHLVCLVRWVLCSTGWGALRITLCQP